MSDTQYRPTEEVREHARKSALAGRPVFTNPHIGADAEVWFAAYREVPEADRGSQPELLPKSSRTRNKRTRTRSSEAHVRALGDRMLPGSTPKPWAVDGAGL
jgi:hypothetical protein